MFIEVLVSRVKRAWFYIGRITNSQKNDANKQAGQDIVTETLWLRFSLIRTLHLKKCGHTFICALCVLLKNIQDTLLSPCPSVVTVTTVAVQGRAVFFYSHPLRQGVFFTFVSSRFWGESQQTSIMKIPMLLLQSTWFGLVSLHTREVSCLFPFPVNLISRFLDTCLSQASCVSCPSRPGSSHAAYPAPTAQLSLTNSLQALPTSGRTGPPSVHVGCGGRTGMS